MKLIKLILLLSSLLPSNAGKEYLITEQNKGQSVASKIGDFQQLATVWAREWHAKYQCDKGVNWVDFNAELQETKNYCGNQDARHHLKDCKINVYHQGLQVDKLEEPRKSEKVVYHTIHNNNNSESGEFGFEKEISYRDAFIVSTANAFKLRSNVKVDTEVTLPLVGEDGVIVEFHFDWNTSDVNEQRHEKTKNITMGERFNSLPYSKSEIKLIMKEVNYNIDFSTNIIIDGFFVFKCNSGNFWIFDPYFIVEHVNSNPSVYSGYLKELVKDYKNISQKEGDYEYYGLKYDVAGKIKGVHSYRIDSEKKSDSLSSESFPAKYYYLLAGGIAGSLLTTAGHLGVKYWPHRGGYEAIPN